MHACVYVCVYVCVCVCVCVRVSVCTCVKSVVVPVSQTISCPNVCDPKHCVNCVYSEVCIVVSSVKACVVMVTVYVYALTFIALKSAFWHWSFF